jgi:hypothetical protein
MIPNCPDDHPCQRALAALRAGRRVAPQLVRIHPMVRETVRAIAHAEPRPSEDLRSFTSGGFRDSSLR